jgi:polyphosphate kinase
LFNFLTGFSHHVPYRKLVVSPVAAKSTIIGLIDEQATRGSVGRITIKVNGLTDPTVIDALYRASAAGVQVRLIVRTLCSLRPGVVGLSENISIKSVVGEFLEHSRVFIFGDPRSADSVLLIGSADLMERNLERRIEVLVPIEDPNLREPIVDAIERTLADDMNSWLLGSDRRWRRVVSVDHRSVHAELRQRAIEVNR